MGKKNRDSELKKVEKIAKETNNKQLEDDVKKRIKNGNTVNKWQK